MEAGGDECRERSEYEDGGTLASGRAERQSGSKRTGASLALSLSLSITLSLSLFVSPDSSALSLTPFGAAEKEKPMAG